MIYRKLDVMVEIGDIRPGNWFIDVRDSNYCTIKEVVTPLKLERFAQPCYLGSVEGLKPIQISSQALSVMGFKERQEDFIKVLNGETYRLQKISVDYYKVVSPTGTEGYAQYIHQLQNVFYDLSGEHLQFTLFGI